jgi:CDP-2,3-bis-(O-geranylgeranyl)-sn-glycerol synthase
VIVDPLARAVFLMAAFTLAGAAHTAWLASAASKRFAQPLDAGLTFRGRRLFGANKTVKGFVVMVPAAAASFALLAAAAPASVGLWDLSLRAYAALGALAAVGFMAGELPNSFVKRQLDIPPGMSTSGPIAAALQFSVDRVDSGLGMLTVVSAVVPTPWTTWAVVLLAGPAIHWTFSLVMFRLGLKARAA